MKQLIILLLISCVDYDYYRIYHQWGFKMKIYIYAVPTSLLENQKMQHGSRNGNVNQNAVKNPLYFKTKEIII